MSEDTKPAETPEQDTPVVTETTTRTEVPAEKPTEDVKPDDGDK